MNRNTICHLTLIILLAACIPSAINLSTGTPHAMASLSAVPTLVSPSATSVPQATLTMTVIPSCELPQKANLKIMPLGDSITFGETYPQHGGYRYFLGTLLENDGYKIDFVGSQKSGTGFMPDPDNEGHSGWKILALKSGIDSNGWLETYQPDIILLHIGTNDVRYGDAVYAPDRLSALLDDILARLPEAYIIVAQIIPFSWGASDGHRLYNEAIPGIVASSGTRVSMVDMQNILSKDDYISFLHPNAKGYEKIALAWESAILALNQAVGCK